MNDRNFNLQSQAYKLILGKILRNEYTPGQKISQKNIERDLLLGRTPVREALVRLQRDGLVYTVPQSGTFVTKIDLDAVKSARFVRESLERRIVVEASKVKDNLLLNQAHDAILLQEKYTKNKEYNKFFEADEDFHKTFYLLTDNAKVWTWLQTINIQLNRFRWLRLKVEDLPWNLLIEQHKEILDAIEKHDTGRAEIAASHHLDLVLLEEKEVITAYQDYFVNIPKEYK
ncbi:MULTISPECIES: GntR family transcriptional regulator [Lactococcus]|jgi:DNA-binding GntR family transcriptional regulator|uniref:GntR family transcriptional regulator n=1 Tax=Lactococcus formosensis TaxID=1281486 RepID=A0A9Q8Y3C1_9LACT|nr:MULTISPECIES: GntR family transcriptional regulator [Lactococcus]USI66520.1 GntR family transcriptional regulator [Lactococcus petauri]USI68964.1 GntR family transcriptional regulator [Lactococcus petauri]USJ21151.1 GntR family transcriptional regulator [Lactococcus formosensis]WJE13631.1 GntR family transcriptional regulator [Lactococcus petauri]